MNLASGTPLELPIMLAAFGPMRRGEICALDTDHIKGNIVIVALNMVMIKSGEYVIKQPKSYAGYRNIEYPRFVADKWKGLNGRVTNLDPDQLSYRFRALLKKSGLPYFRFPDLRHYCASIQHALGVPDAYIMARGGWGSDGVLKNVYRHAMDSRVTDMNNIANDHFSKLCNSKCNSENSNP
jgi:integrase